MRTKNIPVGQLIIEGLGDIDNAYEYVYELIPLIGEVVLWFNTLEADIDNVLCGFISDRTDQKGLLVVGNMMYGTKLDLFERFTSDFFRDRGDQPAWLSSSCQIFGNAEAFVTRWFMRIGCKPTRMDTPKSKLNSARGGLSMNLSNSPKDRSNSSSIKLRLPETNWMTSVWNFYPADVQ